MSFINETRFDGASGPVQFTGADRKGIINIYQHSNRLPADEQPFMVGQFIPDRNASEQFQFNRSAVTWAAGTVPDDGRPRELNV